MLRARAGSLCGSLLLLELARVLSSYVHVQPLVLPRLPTVALVLLLAAAGAAGAAAAAAAAICVCTAAAHAAAIGSGERFGGFNLRALPCTSGQVGQTCLVSAKFIATVARAGNAG